MFGNYSPANLNRQSSAGKNKAGKYPDRHFTTGKHKTGKAKTGNRIFPANGYCIEGDVLLNALSAFFSPNNVTKSGPNLNVSTERISE